MAESDEEQQFKQEFMLRVREARVARGWKQWQAADALGMTQDKYKQYEGRSLLPHYLIGRFCLICRVDPEWLMTGRGKRPIRQFEVVPDEEPIRVAPRAKARKTRAKNVA